MQISSMLRQGGRDDFATPEKRKAVHVEFASKVQKLHNSYTSVAASILQGKKLDPQDLRAISSLQSDLGETCNRYDMLID